MNVLFKAIATVVFVLTLYSCDDDFNSVGGEIIGDVNFQDDQYSAFPVAYSKKFDRVRTSNLVREVSGTQSSFHANLLGVYNDPIYGQSVYSFLSQLQLPTAVPSSFTNTVRLDSVVLNIPYTSTQTASEQVQVMLDQERTVTETAATYQLDSIYGSREFRLSVYKSDYFLRDVDPITSQRQAYYSDDIGVNFGTSVEGTLLYSNPAFVPSPEEIILRNLDPNNPSFVVDRTRVSPRLRVKFDEDIKNLFNDLFVSKAGSPELSNANNFFNYFRGIYVKAEPISTTDSGLLYLNARSANIVLHYSFEVDNTTPTERQEAELLLSFGNNVINSVETEFNPALEEQLRDENQDKVQGEENLYLKGGGDGSYAVIDLFNGTVVNENGEEENELSFLRRQNWLINDANLKFYIDQDKVNPGGDSEPERIYIFNTETGTVLADYGFDISIGLINTQSPINSVLNHLGRISRDSDEKGEFYTIKLTQHLIDLLENEEVENAKLGLCVSQNVNSTTNSIGDTPIVKDEIIPTSSIVSHEGTILYGNTENVPEAKRLKLEIFYTESKDN